MLKELHRRVMILMKPNEGLRVRRNDATYHAEEPTISAVGSGLGTGTHNHSLDGPGDTGALSTSRWM
jgi:hypothetical protein